MELLAFIALMCIIALAFCLGIFALFCYGVEEIQHMIGGGQ